MRSITLENFRKLVAKSCELSNLPKNLREALDALPPGRYLTGTNGPVNGAVCPAQAAGLWAAYDNVDAVLFAIPFDCLIADHFGIRHGDELAWEFEVTNG